jgi:hypothetical protein
MKLANILPPSLTARLRFHLHPGRSNPYGGAFNGQCGRQQIFVDLFRTFRFTHIVETGTFYGVTTEFLARETNLRVFTVEAFRPAYELAKIRLRQYPNVQMFLGDSRWFLRQMAGFIPRDGTPFFYLDAHWEQDLPLKEEIGIVFGSYPRCVVMIDDFQVPNDSGYTFDDFGPSGALTLEYIKPVTNGLSFAYPKLPSSRESGSKRGCIVLASGFDLRKVPSLELSSGRTIG